MNWNKEEPEQLVCEALDKSEVLDLLVVVLPGNTPFYGKWANI